MWSLGDLAAHVRVARVVAIVGAGGKTGCMFALAPLFAQQGETVATTTTTRIRPPEPARSPGVLYWDGSNPAALREAFSDQRTLTIARGLDEPKNKLVGIDPEHVCRLAASGLVDRVLVEADGAREKPLKAPAAHEPVIPDCSGVCIAVMGADAIGLPLDESRVFRAELAAGLAHMNLGDPVGARLLARLADHPRGLFQGSPPDCRRVVLVNKMDGADDTVRAIVREAALLDESNTLWLAGSLREGRLELVAQSPSAS
jgi:probable selenium-dependent hydroxylase accessory protein YqeC